MRTNVASSSLAGRTRHALNEPVSDGAAAQCTDLDEARPDPRARDGDAIKREFDVHTPTGATSTSESHHEGDPGADPRKANPHELMRRERRRAGG